MNVDPGLSWIGGLNRTRVSKTEADFHAPALEVLLTKPPRVARLLVWAMIAVVVTAGIWTTLAEVDEVVVARGKVIPVGYVQTVQSQVSGRVLEIHVSNGERIATGDLLVTLDDTQAISHLTRMQTDFAIAMTKLSLAEAVFRYVTGEQQALPLIPEALRTEYGHETLEQFAAVTAAHDGRLEQLRASVEQAESDVGVTEASVERAKALLPILLEREDSLYALLARGAVARPQWLSAHELVVRLEHELKIETRQLAARRKALARANRDYQAAKLNAKESAQTAVQQARNAMRFAQIAVDEAKTTWALTRIEAPIDGIVSDMTIRGSGTVVSNAEALLNIVPKDVPLAVQAYVSNVDSGAVEKGQFAAVKVDAFPFTRYGLLQARVTYIAADASVGVTPSGATSGDSLDAQLGYRVEAPLAGTALSHVDALHEIMPGMGVSLEIMTGRRTVASYLLEPMLRASREAMRER